MIFHMPAHLLRISKYCHVRAQLVFLFKVWLQAMAKILVHEIDSFCKVNCSHDISAMIDVDNFFDVVDLRRQFPPAISF